MDKLPNEILHNIFIRVSFKERIECMSVCCHWCDALRRRSLLCDIKISNINIYDKFIDMLQLFPDRSAQVEILDLRIDSGNKFDYRKLCNMLPNLHKIIFQNYEPSVSRQYSSGEHIKLENSDSKLEEIIDFADGGLTRQLMESNSCTRLRSLNLQLSGVENPVEKYFVYLKNAPALKSLTLNSGYIGIKDMEKLHKNVPALERVNLKVLGIKSGKLPMEIIPATTVKFFSMDIPRLKSRTTHLNWYEYLSKKYTNLSNFEYTDSNIQFANPDQAIRIYQDGIIPIYKNIGNQLNYFNADNIPTEVDIFNKLSEFGVRFERLDLENNEERPIFTQLAESNLSMYVKDITMMTTMIHSPIMLQNFTSLTKLSIDSRHSEFFWDANLTDYLNGFPPTLTSFSAYFAHVKIQKLPTGPNNIKDFFLRCDRFTPKLGKVLSRYFPKLETLCLRGHLKKNLDIDLSSRNFKRLDIIAYFDNDLPNGFSVTNDTDSQPQYFVGEICKDNPYNYDVVPAKAKDLQNRASVNLKYATSNQSSFVTLPLDWEH